MHGELVVPGLAGGCDGDANPHAFVVALDRERLPAGAFHVQLGAEEPPQGAPEERTVVDVDLSAPGSTATDEDLHTDPSLGYQPPDAVQDGGTLVEGEQAAYTWVVDPDCVLDRLGTFNGTVWRLADAESVSPEMLELAEGGQLEVTLHPLDAAIVVSNAVTDLTYVPAEEGWSC